MRPIILTDLDDTLFQTRRKCPTDCDAADLVPIAFSALGEPSGFLTRRQSSFLEWLSGTGRIIPVTARTRQALLRVRLPFSGAVCAHGGIILDDDGVTLAPWTETVRAAADSVRSESMDFVADLERVACSSENALVAAREGEDGILFYIEVRHRAGDADVVGQAFGQLPLPTGWRRWRNGHRMTFLPPYIGKEKAVAFLIPGLRERFPDAMILGLGDSVSDAPFMGLCDLMMTPSSSNLASVLTSVRT